LHNTELLSSLVATHELGRKLSTAALKGTIGKVTSSPIALTFDAIPSLPTQLMAHGIITAGGKFITVPHSPANNKNEGKLLHHVCGNFYTPPNHKLSKSFMPVSMEWLSDGTIEVCHSSMYVYSMFTV
jgi:hypothetical protein